MGEFNAGKWMIITTIYFIFFIFIVFGATSIESEKYDNTTLLIENMEIRGITSDHYCNDPRYKYDPQTGAKEEYGRLGQDRLFCEESYGYRGESYCAEIPGCNWAHDTTGEILWTCIFGTCNDYYYCNGTIDAAGMGIDTKLSGTRVRIHNESGWWARNTIIEDASPCNHPNVINNQTRCDYFSCTWQEASLEDFEKPTSLFGIVTDIAAFRHDFGFENNAVKYFMTFLLFYIPLLMFIFSAYFMLPFIH